jgi:16S rRNA (adenine1518-N6/adenine1519-N6)-dimethyltransferase
MQIKPKKGLGQHFLIDQNIQRKIISACNLRPTDSVIEIGAGRGELTHLLAPLVRKIYALELDRRLLGLLREALKQFPGAEIVNEDVLRLDLTPYIGKGRLIIIGNIPYYITTPLIEHLFKFREGITVIFLTVQEEFARRIAAGCGSKAYGAFSCFVQYYAEPRILFFIKRTSFFPPPKPDSAFIELRIRAEPLVCAKNEPRLFKIIRAAFGQRRKTLRNSLCGVVAPQKLDLFFQASCHSPDIRPERLCLQEFIKLANL